MGTKGIIFDMDGTLTESMHLWINIGGRYLKERGIEADEEQTYAMSKMLLEQKSQYMIDTFGLTDPQEDLIRGMNQMVERGYYEEVELKPGVAEALAKFEEAGVRMCVATATDRHLTEACLTRLGIIKYFGAIFTCGEEHTTKRKPGIYLKAGASLGTAKEDTFIFEDTYISITGAVQTGYHVIGVPDRWSANNEACIRDLVELFVPNILDAVPYVLK